eukprot:6491910-Amphidinium_carterae.3
MNQHTVLREDAACAVGKLITDESVLPQDRKDRLQTLRKHIHQMSQLGVWSATAADDIKNIKLADDIATVVEFSWCIKLLDELPTTCDQLVQLGQSLTSTGYGHIGSYHSCKEAVANLEAIGNTHVHVRCAWIFGGAAALSEEVVALSRHVQNAMSTYEKELCEASKATVVPLLEKMKAAEANLCPSSAEDVASAAQKAMTEAEMLTGSVKTLMRELHISMPKCITELIEAQVWRGNVGLSSFSLGL